MSRAQREARVYTDSVEMFEARVRAETGHRQAAVDFIDVPEQRYTLKGEAAINRVGKATGKGLSPGMWHQWMPKAGPQLLIAGFSCQWIAAI